MGSPNPSRLPREAGTPQARSRRRARLVMPDPAQGDERSRERDQQHAEPDDSEFGQCFEIEAVRVECLVRDRSLPRPRASERSGAAAEERLARDHAGGHPPVCGPPVTGCREKPAIEPAGRRGRLLDEGVARSTIDCGPPARTRPARPISRTSATAPAVTSRRTDGPTRTRGSTHDPPIWTAAAPLPAPLAAKRADAPPAGPSAAWRLPRQCVSNGRPARPRREGHQGTSRA